ncbi:serine/threonine-protein kinase [Nocardioides daedukensis]|uniref:non-specific serine/threonine protein kinase n=1 Tax=Nocardioides daedukensis TaxID=634462 RepID=A0A7Y9UVW8_9ACTN|nr:serine/threonine-protein kinase [Nocardioides daedukensis]NYG59370.1 serine/threonine-protein kinase [Nocardioides daedukensis]
MSIHGNSPLAGRYQLIDQIGAGGMGSVWRAWDLKNQVFVAAKVLGQHDSGMLLRFVREQSVRIQHPHVVAPGGWAAEDNLVVFTMDLVRGGSIQTLLGDHGRLPESYTAVVLDQTLQALEAIHAAGVVHRDIKPANLLLEPTGTRRPHVRVGDFGVAALIDDVRLTRFPGAIGTDGYMAPEQALGAPPEPQQDLYALGVVGIQMLTGLSPRNQVAAPTGRYGEFLAAITHEDPAQRPRTASIALQMLRQVGVPPGTPWASDPEPPEVFDQLGEVPPPQFQPGPSSGGPASGGPASGGGPGSYDSNPRSNGGGAFNPVYAGPQSGGALQGSAPSQGFAPQQFAPQQFAPTQQGFDQGYAATHGPPSGHQAPAQSSSMLYVALACFAASIGMALAAVLLILL